MPQTYYILLCGFAGGILSALYELYSNDNFAKYQRVKIILLFILSPFAGVFAAFAVFKGLHSVITDFNKALSIACIAGFGGMKTLLFLLWLFFEKLKQFFSIKNGNIINGGNK
jgi:putative effector of murein hydrolase